MAQQVEAMPSQVKLDAAVGSQDFTGSFDRMALQPTLLGQMGATIAQTSANALSTKLGYDEGQNPHGDLLPPITEADKHYQQSYLAQSKNVLSLQVNKMLSDAQTQLSKAYKLTPGMIDDFQNQITQGTAQILKNAPTPVKKELGMQYANAIINTNGALNRRLIAQNKDEAIANMKLADKNTDTSILDNAAMGKPDVAYELYQQKLAQNKKQRETGMMTAIEESTSNTSAKLSYYSGLSNARAMEARNQKGSALADYLTSLSDLKNKPDDLSVSEWNTIGTNTLSLMQHMDALQQTDKNLILSGLHEKLAAGELTEQDVLTAYQSPAINRTDVNNLLTKLYSGHSKQSAKTAKIQTLTANFSSAEAFGEASGETINDAYSALVDAKKQKNPGIAPMEAEASVAAMAGGSIPRFLSTVANLSKSNNVDDVIAASNAYHRVQSVSPQNVIGLPEEAYNFINAFDSFKEINPGDPETALAQTRNALLTRTPEEQKAISANWNAYYRKNYAQPAQRVSLAKKLLGINTLFGATNIQDEAVTADHISNILEKNVKLLGGDIETAKQVTQKQVNAVYGDTWVNGRHEMAYLSLEKIANLHEDGTFFIQRDIVNQVQNSFKMYKEAYDNGHSNFYYRIKDPSKYDISTLKQKSQDDSAIDSRIAAINEKLSALDKPGYFEGMKNDKQYNELLAERDRLTTHKKQINTAFNQISSKQGAIEIERVQRGLAIPPEPKVNILEKGNIDLFHRPIYNRPDGGIETVFSTSVNFDGKEVLIPQIDMQGNKLTIQQAIEEYKKSGRHLGVFSNPEDATRYAKWLHKQQEALYSHKDDRTEVLKLAVVPETNTTLSYDSSQPVIGNYFIKLITDKGHIESLDSIQGFKSAPIYYTPNFNQIKNDYAAFHNRFGAQPNYSAQLNEYMKSKEVSRG
jgi:hypothetical protein